MTNPARTSALTRLGFPALALLIVAGGALARLWGISAEPLWLDEGYSVYAAGKGWQFLWTIVPRYETHPPFYYSLLRLWTLVCGDDLLSVRLLGALTGLIAVPVTALAAARTAAIIRLSRHQLIGAALAALALAASSHVLVEMAREVRPYPVMILTYAIATLAIVALAARKAAGLPLAGKAYGVYLAMVTLMLWLHNMGPLYAAALGLALLAVGLDRGFTRRDALWLIGGHLLAIAIWLPGALILLDQAPTWISSTWLKFSFDGLGARLSLLYSGPGDDMRIAAVVLGFSGIAALARLPAGRRLALALLILALLPALLSILISMTIAPVFIIRTMTPLAIPAIVLMGVGAVGLAGLWRWPALAALIWLVAQSASVDIRARHGGPMQNWYGAVHWLQARWRPGDMVYAYPNEGALPFDRAVRDLGLPIRSRAIPTDIPALNPPPGSWYVSGSRGVPSLDRAHLRAIAQEPFTRAVPTVWLLRLGPWAYDKGDVFVEELSRDREDVGQYRSGPIDIVGLRRR